MLSYCLKCRKNCFKILKILGDKAFIIAKKSKHDEYERGFASTVYKSFDNAYSGGGAKNENMSNQLIAGELQVTIIGKFETRKVQLSFKDNFSSAELADMQLISKFFKRIYF